MSTREENIQNYNSQRDIDYDTAQEIADRHFTDMLNELDAVTPPLVGLASVGGVFGAFKKFIISAARSDIAKDLVRRVLTDMLADL